MESDAAFDEFDGKSARVIEFPGFRIDRRIWHEPTISGAAPIGRMIAPPDIVFIFERHADRQSVDRHVAGLTEMKNRFMIVVEKTRTVDRLEMSGRIITDTDGFDPDDVILQHEQVAKDAGHVK